MERLTERLGVGNRAHLVLLATIVGASVVSVLAGSVAVTGDYDAVLWLAFCLLAVICGLMLIYVLKASWLGGDPFQPAVGFLLVAFLGYGVSALHARYGQISTVHAVIDPLPGLIIGLIATLFFSIGYVAPIGRRLDGKAFERWWPSWDSRRAFVAGLVCFGIGAIASAYYFLNGEYFAYTRAQPLEEQFSTIGYFREFLFIGLTIVAVAAYGPRGTARMRRVAIGLALLAVTALLPTGIRYYLLVAAASLFVSRHYYYRKFRLISIVLAIALIIGLVYPIGEMYRRQYQAQSFGSQSLGKTVTGVTDQLSQLGPQGYMDFAFGPTLGRVDLATPASALKSVVPSTIPYKFGSTFTPVLIFWIPRFVWPNKPTFQYDNELGRAEGLIAQNDFRTSVKYSYVGELYLNFGLLGVIFGMALYGLLFRVFYQVAIRRRHPIGILMYSTALVLLWTVETPLGPALAGGIRDVVSGLFVLWLCGAFRPSAVQNSQRAVAVWDGLARSESRPVGVVR